MKNNAFLSAFAVVVLISTVIFFSRFSPSQEVNSIEINQIKQVDFNNSKNVLLDVRTINEFKQGHIPYSKNIDVMSLGFEEVLKKENKNSNFYIYCRSGSRSIKAYNLMKVYGFNNVINLEGGIQKYNGSTE